MNKEDLNNWSIFWLENSLIYKIKTCDIKGISSIKTINLPITIIDDIEKKNIFHFYSRMIYIIINIFI